MVDEDLDLLKQYGARAYRISISWSRVIPLGGRNDLVNNEGLEYYVRLVNRLKDAGLEPVVTLYHWDLPAELEKRYKGQLNREEFIADFVHYARVMFEALGNKVKFWITFNEPVSASYPFPFQHPAPIVRKSGITRPYSLWHLKSIRGLKLQKKSNSVLLCI